MVAQFFVATFVQAIALSGALISSCWAACSPQNFPLRTGTYIDGNQAGPWKKTDTGVIVSSFVSLPEPLAAVLTTHHGVDLSVWNTNVNYTRILDCGAEFAIVKMQVEDKSTKIEVIDAKTLAAAQKGFSRPNTSFSLIPYYYFGDPTDANESVAFDLLKKLLDGADWAAWGKAGIEGLPPGRTVMIDAETKLDPKRESVPPNHVMQNFATRYSRHICSLIGRIRDHIKPETLTVMLYTGLSNFRGYFDAMPTSEKIKSCVYQLPVLLAWTTADGGGWDETAPGFTRETKSANLIEANKICYSGNGNLCLMRQYTQRGILGSPLPTISSSPKVEPPPHVDLDRFLAPKSSDNGLGTVLVQR